jgi:O-antigen ligase
MLLAGLFSPWRTEALVATGAAGVVGLALILLHGRLRAGDEASVYLGLTLGLLLLGGLAFFETVLLERGRAAATTFHPNILGAAALLATFSLVGGFRSSTSCKNVLYAVGMIAGAVALLYSGSRGAYLGFAVGVVSYLVLQLGVTRKRTVLYGLVLAGAGVAAGFLIAPATLTAPLLERFEALDSPIDPVGRIDMWALALELAQQRPFLGYGFGAWERLLPALEPAFRLDRSPHAHSLYLQLLLDGGLLTLVAVLAWGGALAWALLERARRSHTAAATLATLLAFATHNLSEPLLYHGFLAGLLWLTLSLGLVADTYSHTPATPPSCK